FKSMPAVFVDSVSNTLLHLLLQKYASESLGVESEMVLPSFRQSAIICTHFKKGKDILLSRTEPKGNDSGWFFGCLYPDHDHQATGNLQRVSLYEAAVSVDDRIIPYLGLPAGIEVHLNDSNPKFLRNDEALAV